MTETLAAASISTSGKTRTGAWPPNSRLNLLTCSLVRLNRLSSHGTFARSVSVARGGPCSAGTCVVP